MRVTFVIGSLRLGGAERMLVYMADYWAGRGWDVTIVTYCEEKDHYNVSAKVRRISAAVSNSANNLLSRSKEAVRRLRRLRCAILESNPQILISFLNECSIRALIALIGSGVPVIVAERNDPRHDPLPFQWALLRWFLYPMATSLVIQTESALSFFGPFMRARSCVIPNPVAMPVAGRLLTSQPANRQGKRIVALGRLAHQKGFDLLIEAFGKIAMRNPQWSLIIYGEGLERSNLEALVRQKGLEEKIFLPGAITEISASLLQADIFVLSSRYEGFPNALCEAMACGLAVVSFSCESGPREIIRHDVDGVLVPAGDVNAMAEALEVLMRDDIMRKRLASRAPEVSDRFHPDRVMKLWEDLLIRHATIHSTSNLGLRG